MTRPLDTVAHAITVRQPYAQCIAIGRKTVENRPRYTSFRGPIAIHAGKKIHTQGDADPRVIALYGRDASWGMKLGAVIAVADLVDCHPAAYGGAPGRTCCEPWGEPFYGDGGPCYHLVLDRAVMLPAVVPARGSLTLPWTLPTEPLDVQAAVRRSLAEAVSR
ncbi:hypothetical protein [Micromonospora sp. WMMD737]|uniref:hypothetical protein n=1 Tax=Micromonospora sp. WMMD737 TaxID=3404113 RepID=UPI003B93372B